MMERTENFTQDIVVISIDRKESLSMVTDTQLVESGTDQANVEV